MAVEKKAKDQTIAIPAGQATTTPTGNPLGLSKQDTNDMVELLKKRDEVLTRLLEVAIRATHPGQWTDQGGKPFPTAAAAEVMARRCLVSLRNVHYEKILSSDDKGQYYLYVCSGSFALPGGNDTIEAMGTCSMRDQFFSRAKGADRPTSQIDEGSIMKAAYSNMMVNGVTRLLGVRNLTWERLARLGIHRAETPKVSYDKGSNASPSESRPTSSNDVVCKFGKWKGKPLASLEDKELEELLRVSQKIVDKKDPKWHDANVKWLGQVEREIKARSGSGGQTTFLSEKDTSGSGSPAERNGGQSQPSSQGEEPPQKTPYEQILELGKHYGATRDLIHKAIKEATGKTSSGALTSKDIILVQQTFQKWEDEMNARMSDEEKNQQENEGTDNGESQGRSD